MACPAQDITDTELSILKVLWGEGSATIRQITDVLYPEGSQSHYATVQKLLDRLEAEGFVSRRRAGKAHLFEAAIHRDELIGRRLKTIAEKLCDGSLSPLLTHLILAEKLTARERSELRTLLDGKGQKPQARQ
jgi:predicted transcriptional regulator